MKERKYYDAIEKKDGGYFITNAAQERILRELDAQCINWYINNHGLKVRGKRTTWLEAFNIAFLGWKHGMNQPKIVKTFSAA